ncbi:hypothetical protein KOR42_37560 [Thalassoglobus neptunius]|uniref:DUF1570 domain-containing protein n=1 Tax=Thalassoglobus neptunius TaxID=1938619 RepID=A0A5C5WGN3_9PLAN|nr:hypothetical protein [Thalassoglobus neptunius]TWT49938.1 hypothetical protein KOR42_37560 [Thalassoglobus neptunius]
MKCSIRSARCVALSFSLIAIHLLGAQAVAKDDRLQRLFARFEAIHSDFAEEMESIAEFCEQNSYLTDAERIHHRARYSQRSALDLRELPEQLTPPLPRDLDPVHKQWRIRLRAAEKDHAIQLYRLAREAIEARHPSLAYQLIRHVLYFDPDHRYARELLGYVQDDDHWTTPFARRMKLKGFVDHPDFGWIAKEHVSRYENGERLFKGKWISAEREKILRSDFKNAWEIETENFLIQTNHSLERGVELGRNLEMFHQFFMEQFTAIFSTPQQMQRLFNGAASPSRVRRNPHRIAYFRNKDEFIRELKTIESRIEIANGFYLPRTRTAYFFHVDDPEAKESNIETMFHEVTHQLLGESSSKTIEVGEYYHFWVIEGFPCYMESFETIVDTTETLDSSASAKSFSIGDPEHPRIYWAKKKALEELYYIPMRRFMVMGKREFMRPDDNDVLHAYYSQATGLCHFFLHYEGGIYRDAFMEYLSQIYSPDDRVRLNTKTMEQLLGIPFETLDRQYLEYLKTL